MVSNNFDFWDEILTHISTCFEKSDGLSYDELRAVSLSQIAILTSSGRELK